MDSAVAAKTPSLFALVDWRESNGLVVPWMAFDTEEEFRAAVSGCHPSWPRDYAEIEVEPRLSVRTRRAKYSKRGEPYCSEVIGAYRLIRNLSASRDLPLYMQRATQ